MFEKIKVILFTEINSKLGAPFLRVLSAHPMVNLVAVVTSPVDAVCDYFVHDKHVVNVESESLAIGIPVLRPKKVRSEETVKALRSLDADYFIVANFQQLLTKELLELPKIMPLNFHPSPLPKYAGLAPFYWMIRNGETQTAISVIKMDVGLDTGDIVMQRPVVLTGHENSIELRTRQEEQNVLMLIELIPMLVTGDFSHAPQRTESRTYFGRPKPEDYELNFNLEANIIERHIRAAYRHPGASLMLPDGGRITILSSRVTKEKNNSTSNGCIKYTKDGVFVSAKDFWLELLTVEINGTEVSSLELLHSSSTLDAIESDINVADKLTT